jgi:hypothetical protein
MTEEKAQSPADSMTSQPGCYHGNCRIPPKWGISSSVRLRNPDGSPLTLFACDDHYGDLTTDLRAAGTRYSIFPIGGPHVVSLPTAEEEIEDKLKNSSLLSRIALNSAVAVAAIVVAPFLLAYYGGRWLLGWRPPEV